MEKKQPLIEEEAFVLTDLDDSNVGKQIIYLKRHSRSSSESSCGEDEQSDPILATKEEPAEDKTCRSRITGRCLCKFSIVLYLLGCVLIATLYVIFYGNKQQGFGEAWIPGKPTSTVPTAPKPQYSFVDLPYTEWLSQRWTYDKDAPFSDWPSLPPTIKTIQQVASGSLSYRSGVWLLTDSELVFTDNLKSHDPAMVEFYNVTEELDIEVQLGNRVVMMDSGRLFLVTLKTIYLLDCSQPTDEDSCEVVGTTKEPLPFDSTSSGAFSLSTNSLWLGTPDGLYEATIDTNSNVVIQNITVVFEEVLAVAWRSNILPSKDYSSSAPFIFDGKSHDKRFTSSSVDNHMLSFLSRNSGWFQQRHENYRSHNDVPFGLLVVGTKERLYFYDGTTWWFEWVSVWRSGLGGVIDGPPTSIAVTSTGEIFISNNVSVSRLNTDYTFDRIGPLQGLPYNQILSLHFNDYTALCPRAVVRVDVHSDNDDACNSKNSPSSGTLWIGTEKGFSLYDVATSKFRGYFYGPRWHSGESILGVTSTGDNVVLHTDKGMTVVWPEEWTLKQKADHYQNMLPRHTRPPGLVADCPLTNYTPSTCSPYTTDNDGLWTSVLVAAETFRYKVTNNATAKENAWNLFKGMQFLVDVTGVRGLMARSVVNENVTVNGGVWYESTSEPGWLWKANTSSDEVVGHMFAYPLIYDLVAEDDDAMKDEVSALMDDIVGYIHNNSYYLIDVTNQSTRWGVWSPSELNLNQSWSDEHGLNSLQILSYLLSAYRITSNGVYYKAFKDLFGSGGSGGDEDVPTHYGLNMINQKITFPRDDNFSDDELSFFPYFVYFNAIKHLTEKKLDKDDPLIVQYAKLSLERSWRVVGPEKSSAWTVIYAYAMDKAMDSKLIEQLVWNLRSWPLELVMWGTNNSHRLDIRKNPEQDRDFKSGSQSVHVLPANERTQLRWNINPYQLDSIQENSEMDPGAWLLPYWFARWLEML